MSLLVYSLSGPPTGARSGPGARSPEGQRSLGGQGRPQALAQRVGAFDHAARLHEGGGVSWKKLDGSKGCASILPFAPACTRRARCGGARPARGAACHPAARWPEARRPLRACSGAVAGRADSQRPPGGGFSTWMHARGVYDRAVPALQLAGWLSSPRPDPMAHSMPAYRGGGGNDDGGGGVQRTAEMAGGHTRRFGRVR